MIGWVIGLLVVTYCMFNSRRFQDYIGRPGYERVNRTTVTSTQSPRPSDKAQPKTNKPTQDGPSFKPSPVDIVVVQFMFTKGLQLPPDFVQAMLDHAEYWAHSSNEINFELEHGYPMAVNGRSRLENKFLIRSFPVGLTAVDAGKTLAEELAYDTGMSKCRPLAQEHDPAYFTSFPKYPTPVLVSPVRKVVFSIQSRDQGNGGLGHRGTYYGSWTWFEAGLERFDACQQCDPQCTQDFRHESPHSSAPTFPVCALRSIQPAPQQQQGDEGSDKYEYVPPMQGPDEWVVQRNKVAEQEWIDYEITWSYLDDVKPDSTEGDELVEQGRGRATGDGAFVRGLKVGDVVTVWGMARFPAWINFIARVKVDVYWAI